MDKEIISGTTVEECLEKACSKYNLSKNNIKYEVIEVKNGLFKKRASIEVEIVDNSNEENNKKDGNVEILNGKINVKDPEEGGECAKIVVPSNIGVQINGKEVKGTGEIYNSSDIEIYFHEIEKPERKVAINTSPDKMNAYISINYVNKNVYKLKDALASNKVVLESEILRIEKPPMYTKEEILEILKASNINYGIISDNLLKCTSGEEIIDLPIAQGVKVENDEDDKIEFKFSIKKNNKFQENQNGKIDFKSIGFINAVEEGTILAERHAGKEGHDGRDIYGNVIKKKSGKIVKINIGEGCEFKNENVVVAVRKGEPIYTGNKISVIAIHEVNSDVDLKTGNIKFVGDVFIHGNVSESMKVESEHNIKIDKNVQNATVSANGNIIIEKNAIFSNIFGGGQDVFVLKQLEFLNTIDLNIKNIIEAVGQVKHYNIHGKGSTDGQILKALLEGKFRLLPRLCEKFIEICDMEANADIVNFFKSKIIGMGPLNVENLNELDDLALLCEQKVTNLKNMLSVPVDVSVGYCQNSKIESSGNIFITGKGEYISNLTARNNIIFTNDNSVARGGTIKAKNEIKCGVIGSIAGVSTKIQVERHGNIYAEIAYQNTRFVIGNKEHVVENPCKGVHVYINKDDELIVDKLLL